MIKASMTPVVFSVVMPVYNRASVVGRAIDSVLAQTVANFELIIVDDHSNDGTASVVKRINDSRIRFITLDSNNGPAVARNTGIRAAQGNLISFLDSDDEFSPRFLEKSLECLKDTSDSTGFMWTGINTLVKKGDKVASSSWCWTPKHNSNTYFQFLDDLRIGTNSGITIKRKVFDEIGLFDERLKAAEDTDLFLRITQRYQYTYCPEFLMTIHQEGGDRLTRNKEKNAAAYEIIVEKNREAINANSALKKKFWYKCMFLNYQSNNFERARGYFRKLKSENLVDTKVRFVKTIYEVFGMQRGHFIHRTFAGRTLV